METIGLIGLGLIGIPLAQNLIESGYRVVGYRRSEAPDFTALGGELLNSPCDVMAAADIVLCCIPNDDALREVVSGAQGLASGDCAGKIVVELSTLSESAKREAADQLAAKGGIMLDGAVSGLPPMVRAKSAVYFLSGDETAFNTVRPVLDALSKNLSYMGPFGAATQTKLCANLLVAANLAAIAETLSFGAKQGLDLDRLVKALGDGAGSSIQFKARAAKMVAGDWQTVLGATSTLAKDVNLIASAAKANGCPVPVLEGVKSVYDAAIENGFGGTDVASIFGSVAQMAGLPVPGKGQ